MAQAIDGRMSSRLNTLREEEREFRIMLRLTFVIFLVAAIVSRFLPRRWRLFPAREGARRKSVFGEAWEAANITVPFAFGR